eukprot:323974_1
MAVQVIGGICSLIAELLSGVKSILTDPIPDVRSASALAILSLNESLGGGNENESNKDLDGISIKSKDVIQQDETSIISGRFIRKNVLGQNSNLDQFLCAIRDHLGSDHNQFLTTSAQQL